MRNGRSKSARSRGSAIFYLPLSTCSAHRRLSAAKYWVLTKPDSRFTIHDLRTQSASIGGHLAALGLPGRRGNTPAAWEPMSFISDAAGQGVYNALFSVIVLRSESVTGINMVDILPGALTPSSFISVNSPTCTAYPMPSGNGTAPLKASAAGTATPVGTPSANAARPPSSLPPLQPAGCSGSGTPSIIFNADADHLTQYAQLDTGMRAGYS